jgi:ABC-type transport system substrate-binding protein
MIELDTELEPQKQAVRAVPLSFQSTFQSVYKKLQKWTQRFCLSVDNSIFNEFASAQKDNFTRWENSGLQKLIQLSGQKINPFQRSSYVLQAQVILNLEMPFISLFYQSYQSKGYLT